LQPRRKVLEEPVISDAMHFLAGHDDRLASPLLPEPTLKYSPLRAEAQSHRDEIAPRHDGRSAAVSRQGALEGEGPMPYSSLAGPGRRLLTALIVAAILLTTGAAAQTRDGRFLGLTAPSGTAPELWEGRTNYRLFLRPTGEIRAIMLFARF